MLYILFLLVVVTGIIGLVLQQFLPRWMTFEVQCEVPFEQIPIVCSTLRDKADMDMQSKCASLMPATGMRIRRVYAEVVRPFLGWPGDRGNLLNDPKKTSQFFAEMSSLPGAGESTLPQLLTQLERFLRRTAQPVPAGEPSPVTAQLVVPPRSIVLGYDRDDVDSRDHGGGLLFSVSPIPETLATWCR